MAYLLLHMQVSCHLEWLINACTLVKFFFIIGQGGEIDGSNIKNNSASTK